MNNNELIRNELLDIDNIQVLLLSVKVITIFVGFFFSLASAFVEKPSKKTELND